MKKSIKDKAKKEQGARSKRLLTVIVAVFLGAVLTLSLTLGIISIVRNANAFVSYKGITLNGGVTNYLAATRKSDFMKELRRSGVDCYDSPEFWSSAAEDGRTYGELLEDEVELYLRSVIVGAYTFDKHASLSRAERDALEDSTEEVLEFKADGSRKRFDELAEPMGFDFSDLCDATELLYKYRAARTVVFGEGGAVLKDGQFTEECNEFYSTYSHVMLLFVRTEGEYELNSETGREEFVEYTDDRKADIQADIERIRAILDDGDMSPAVFMDYMDKYDYGDVNADVGYYFAPTSSYTEEFARDCPDVVLKALSMQEGTFAEAEASVGTCFVYKYPRAELAYYKSTLEHFFGDFFSDAAEYLFAREINGYCGDVRVKDAFYSIDLVRLPYNYELVASY